MMYRHLLVCLLLVCLSPAAFAATTVVLNGKVVTLPVIDASGKAYVDIVALMQMLGGKANFDAKANKLYINSPGATAPSAIGSGGGAPGTAQLAGDNGEIGKVYSIRKDSPLYFSLKRAEYTLEQARLGDQTATPNADEKLLALHFTVQNPLKTEQFVRYDSLRFTAVDANNMNHEANYHWVDPVTESAISLELKPAQTLQCYTVIKVSASGEVPKLMVLPEKEGDGPVLRYDLRGNVTPLSAPYVDPADATGATVLDPIPSQLGAAYPLGLFDVTVEKTEYSTKALGDIEVPEDGRLLAVTVLLKNDSTDEEFLEWQSISPVLTTDDGEELTYLSMLGATANRELRQDFKPGKELRVRLIFGVPDDSQPKTLSIKKDEGHTFNFEIPQQ